MKEEDSNKSTKMRFGDRLLVFLVLLGVSAIEFLILKVVWGKQVTWEEVLIMVPVTTVLVIVIVYYQMKSEEKRTDRK